MAQGMRDCAVEDDADILPLSFRTLSSPSLQTGGGMTPTLSRMERLRFDDFSDGVEQDREDEVRRGIPEEEVAILLEKAREEAYEWGVAEGYDKGHADAMDALEADIHRLCLGVSESLGSLEAHKESLSRLLEDSAASFVKRLTGLLAPRLPEEFFGLHLEEMVMKVARSALADQQVVFRLSPAQLEAHGERIKALVAGENRSLDVVLESDASLAPGRVQVLWRHGEMELNLHEFSDRIVESILSIRKEK